MRSTAHARYTVLVDDNFHYMDEDERYKAGEYTNYERAVTRCKQIVDASLRQGYQPGITGQELYKAYRGFGEDPFITPDPPDGQPPFSAWAYAKDRCAEMCVTRPPESGDERSG